MKKNSIKYMRINGEIQKVLADIIRGGLKDPRVSALTSVTDAEVTTDLKQCKVYISAYGDEKAKSDTMAGLQSAEGYLRRQLAKTLNLRNTPELIFVPDHSLDYGMKMNKLIDTVMEQMPEEENEESESDD